MKTRLVCLDINTREILQTFVLETDSDKPNIDRAISLKAKINTLENFNFDLTNYSSKDEKTFFMASSDPNLL